MAEQGPAPETSRVDPFELWRQMYETNEQIWTKAIKDLTSTPTYAEAQGKMLEVFLNVQKSMRDATTAQLAAYNFPTRDDVSSIGELMVGVEEKVDQLDETVAKLEGVVSEQNQRLARMELALKAIEADGKANAKAVESDVKAGAKPTEVEGKTSAKEDGEPASPPRTRRAAQS